MNYYEVLGVPTNARVEEIRHAYLAKATQLHPDRFPTAPPDVLAAVAGAAATIEEAWHTLRDPERRQRYDAQLASGGAAVTPARHVRLSAREMIAEHVWAMERELGWPLTEVLGLRPDAVANPVPVADGSAAATGVEQRAGLTSTRSNPSIEIGWSPLYDPIEGLEKVADWLAPHRERSREITVPNVCGLAASEVFYAVAKADLHIHFVSLTEHPDGDGFVVDQDPAAGSTARRHSTLTVRVVYRSPTSGGQAEGV